MNPVSIFHRPLPGDSARYYCSTCQKSFTAEVANEGIFSMLKKLSNQGRVKCPACKRLCGLDPRIQY